MDEDLFHTEALLVNLIEEASEVIQMASKALRFGMDSYNPNDMDRIPNCDLLAGEIGNMNHIVQELIAHGDVSQEIIKNGQKAKRERLNIYPVRLSQEERE